jgi:hypothetical protein
MFYEGCYPVFVIVDGSCEVVWTAYVETALFHVLAWSGAE